MKEKICFKNLKKVLSSKEMKNLCGGSGYNWCYCPDSGEEIVGYSCTHYGCGTFAGYGGCGCP